MFPGHHKGAVLLSIKLTARLAGVTVPAVRAAIRRERLRAVTLAEAESTAVRFVDLREAARYYGWPPALVNRLEDEWRTGVPDGEAVYKLDHDADAPDSETHNLDAVAAQPTTNEPHNTHTATVPTRATDSATQAEDVTRAPDLAPDPTSAGHAWERAVRESASASQKPGDPPPGFRLVLPRKTAKLQAREVYDLVVDGEVVGTIADRGFASYVREKCFRGEVFVNGKGGVKWRPRVPLRRNV